MNRETTELIARVVDWADTRLDERQVSRLERYADWLREEAIPAGGLGPKEADRVWDRHIADSLLFAGPFAGGPPANVLDAGTGVGLPGIPLAIMWSETKVTLLDRAGRRTRLVDRACRTLDLKNIEILQSDVDQVTDEYEALTFRSSLRLGDALATTSRLLRIGGVAVFGLTRRAKQPGGTDEALSHGQDIGVDSLPIAVPREVIGEDIWLVRMTRRSMSDASEERRVKRRSGSPNPMTDVP